MFDIWIHFHFPILDSNSDCFLRISNENFVFFQVCYKINRVDTKKLLKNTDHNNSNNHERYFGKQSKSVLHLGPSFGDIFLDTASALSSSGLSFSQSSRAIWCPRQSLKSTSSTSALCDTTNRPLEKSRMHRSSTQTAIAGEQLDLPSAPSLGYILFNNEEQADVIFLVGTHKDNIWRFPAHCEIIKNSSSFFNAVSVTIEREKRNNNLLEIPINWCEPEIFQMILK